MTVLPAWLRGKKAFEWIAIANTRQAESPAVLADLVAAGLTDRNWKDIGYGTNPLTGTFTFSGGALRAADCTLMSFGGGGRTWGGNEVRALPLLADAPRWYCLVKPSTAAGTWPNASNSKAYYNPDGTPVSRHSYSAPHYNTQRNALLVYGCGPVWPMDQGKGWAVDGIELVPGARWYPAAHFGTMNSRDGGFEGNWTAQNPRTGDVYFPSSHLLQVWKNDTGAPGGIIADMNWVDFDRGIAMVDPVRNRLVRVGPHPGKAPTVLGYFDLSAQPLAYREPATTGIPLKRASGAGFLHDPILDKYLYFTDEGVIHAIDPVTFDVALLPVTGTPPVTHGAGVNGGDTAIYTRMQYVPALKGIVIAQAFDKPVYFVRTA